jgi:hypothetical protein
MCPAAEKKAETAKTLLHHYLIVLGMPRDLAVASAIIVDGVIAAAAEEACYQMSRPDDDREPIAEGDYHLYAPPASGEASP